MTKLYEVVVGHIWEEPEQFSVYEDALKYYNDLKDYGMYVALRVVQVKYIHTTFEE